MKKNIIIIIFIFSAVALGILGYILITSRPSSEMQALESIIKDLELPEPYSRYKDDTGYHRDWKNTSRYNRRITLEYNSSQDIITTRNKLQSLGWRLAHPKSDSASTFDTETHIKDGVPACIETIIQKSDISDEHTADLTIGHTNDDMCDFK